MFQDVETLSPIVAQSPDLAADSGGDLRGQVPEAGTNVYPANSECPSKYNDLMGLPQPEGVREWKDLQPKMK
ncbi:hypothetical protein CgunFtcFv8_017534 [Champsocephalus gunnari]|nr:hypothetical protein CgunFtcFv8_017534 [Champsocephalus gunnari]